MNKLALFICFAILAVVLHATFDHSQSSSSTQKNALTENYYSPNPTTFVTPLPSPTITPTPIPTVQPLYSNNPQVEAFIVKARQAGYSDVQIKNYLISLTSNTTANSSERTNNPVQPYQYTPQPTPTPQEFGRASSYQQVGNYLYGSDGSTYSQIGNTTMGSNGASYNSAGNFTYGSDGTSYNHVGNFTYGSNGTNCYTYGSMTTCSGGN